MKQLETIKELINQGDINKANEALEALLTQPDYAPKDEVYYLRGKAYRKPTGSKPSTIINPPSILTPKVLPCKPTRW